MDSSRLASVISIVGLVLNIQSFAAAQPDGRCEDLFASKPNGGSAGKKPPRNGGALALPSKIDQQIAERNKAIQASGLKSNDIALRTGIDFVYDNPNDEPVFLRAVPGHRTLMVYHIDLMKEIENLLRTNSLAAKMQAWGVSRIEFDVFAGRTLKDYGNVDELPIARYHTSNTTIISHTDTRTGIPAGLMLKSGRVADTRYGVQTKWRSSSVESQLLTDMPAGIFHPLADAFAKDRFLALTGYLPKDVFAQLPEANVYSLKKATIEEIVLEDLGFRAEPYGGLDAFRNGTSDVRTGNSVRSGSLWESFLNRQETHMALAAYRDTAATVQQKKARALLIHGLDLLHERKEKLVPGGVSLFILYGERVDPQYSGHVISRETDDKLTGPIHWSQRGASGHDRYGQWKDTGLEKAYAGPRIEFFGLQLSPVMHQLVTHLETSGYQPDIKTGRWKKIEKLPGS